jgi:carboxylesterase type B
VWNPIVDGTFLTDYPSVLASQGKFVPVPIINGANTDEGASFSVMGLNTTQDVFDSLFYWRDYALSPASIRTLLDLYPNEPQVEPPYAITTDTVYPSLGLQWRRSAAIGGDLVMIAQRRKTCEEYVKGGVRDVYSFRFDTPLYNATAPVAVGHGVNVMFSFQNISGAMGPVPQYSAYRALSLGIGKAYANFAGTGNPNGVGGRNQTGLPLWPAYDLANPTNMVLNANGSFIEADTWRAQGISFINNITRELLA